ncbi:MAG: hypothetical protein WKG06_12990 [Segetibacter sp.]
MYEIIGIENPKTKEVFDRLFGFIIPIANIFYNEVTQEGPLDGNLADKGIESWRNIYRVRKAFYENDFYRNENIG